MKTFVVRRTVFAAVQICSFTIAAVALANPSDGKVVAGAASFEGGAGTLTIQQLSDRGIIDWQKFSIGAGEVTKFLQPGPNSALLNRVTGGESSQLLGALQANGRIFLINPNGILIGGGATIDTNGFVASTLDLNNDEFLAGGDMKFFGSSTAKVINLGTIHAGSGDIFLFAREVENHGTLSAPNGVVGLGAGQEVLLKSAGDERISVSPGGTGSAVNAGKIAAVQAELKANGGNMYALAINNTGTIRATGTTTKNGRVIFSAGGGEARNAGTISARQANGSGGRVKLHSGSGGKTVNAGTIDASGKAPGAKGGRVEVLGDNVDLTAGSLVDVSGDTAGGVALIGGDMRGKNPAIQNAKTTRVAAGARINADAITRGDGGTAIVWADDATEFAGGLTARGGNGGGGGGFAEVSSNNALTFTGTADLSAVDGRFGTLLLDPKNTRVATGGTATAADAASFGTNPGSDVLIAPGTLRDVMANVLIQTNNDFTLQSALDLSSTTGGTPTPGKSFTVLAGRTIQIEAALTTAGGDVNMTANATTTAGVNANFRDAGTAAIVFQAGGGITTNGGHVNLLIDTGSGLNDSSSQDISLPFSTINSGAGDVALINRGPGNAGIAGSVLGYVAGNVLANKLTVQAEGQILFYNPLNNVNTLLLTNGGQVDYVDADALIVGQATNVGGPQLGKGDVKIKTTTGDLTINAPGFLLTTTTNPAGVFTLDAAGKLFVNEGVTKLLTQVGVDVTYKAGSDVTLTAAEVGARNLTVAAGGKIAFNLPTVSGKFGVVAGDGSPHGKVTLTANGDITATTTSTITARDLTMTATTGLIDLDGVVNAQLLKASALGDIRVDRPTDNSIGALGAISSGANISLTDTALGLQITGLVQSTAVNGIITIKATGGSTVQFLASANCRIEVQPGGVINFESTAQILDGTTPSFIGGSLAVIGRAIGGGTTNPLNTQVSRLEAKAVASGGFGGFAFITNNEAVSGTLAIGGVSANLGGVTGDGRNSTNVSVNLVNNGSIVLEPAVGTDWIGAVNPSNPLGDVSVTATGAASDISVGSGFFGVGIISDSKLTLNAGNNILIGEGANASIRGGTDVELTAGGSVHVKSGASIINLGSGLLKATATNSIQSLATTLDSTAFRSGGGITLISTNGQIVLGANDGTNPVVRANENGVTNNVLLQANKMTIDGKVAASGGNVELQQYSSNVSVVVGTKTANDLSFTDAEIDRISGARLMIGSFMALPTTSVTVTAPISRPTSGLTYGALQLSSPGAVNIQSSLDLGLGNFSVASLNGGIQGGGNVTAHDLSLFSSTGSITLSGNVNAVNLEINAPGWNVYLEGNNDIGTLTSARYLQEFKLRDTANGLRITGMLDGSADSYGYVSVTGGALTLAAGTEVIFGANNPFGYTRSFKLHSDTAFINQAGAGAIVTEFGARYLIYVPDNGAAQLQLGGLTPTFALAGVSFPTEPVNTGNGVLIAAANHALPLSTSLGSPPEPPYPAGPSFGTGSTRGSFVIPTLAIVAQLLEIEAKRTKELALAASSAAMADAADPTKPDPVKRREAEQQRLAEEAKGKEESAKARRLAIWPPEGSIPNNKVETRRLFEAKLKEDGRTLDKYLYWEMSNLPPAEKEAWITRTQNSASYKTTTQAQRDVAELLRLQDCIAFTDSDKLAQFLNDRGGGGKALLSWTILGPEGGKVEYVRLRQNGPILSPSAPVVAAPPPPPAKVETVVVTTVSSEINTKWPPPK